MKVLFVGPSLPDAGSLCGDAIVIRPPATQGDLLNAIEDGASAIGLVDGGFEYTAAVWHKEILYGLSRGVMIFGAASMGALRAAECHPFGMVGVGRIFEDYRDGIAIDDADVALIHAPAEMNYRPLTIPMVNVHATLSKAVEEELLTQREANSLHDAARDMFFKDRTWKAILRQSEDIGTQRRSQIASALEGTQIDQKRCDAIMLVERLMAAPPGHLPPLNWSFQKTSIWREMFEQFHK